MWRRTKLSKDSSIKMDGDQVVSLKGNFSFPQINELHDDILVLILEFVAEAPHERSNEVGGDCDLTNSLPLVSKKFNTFVDYLWKCTFERLVSTKQDHDGGHWKETFQLFLDHEDALESDTYTIDERVSKRARLDSSEDKEGNETYESYLIRKALQIGNRKRQQLNGGEEIETMNPYLWLYSHLLHFYRRYQSPLFFMPDEVRLGSAFNLHFFEPRYRRLIAGVMAPYPSSARNGAVITAESCGGNFPTFIYANRAPLQRGTIACIVQVRQCTIYPNGTADVCLLPVSYARINVVGVADERTKLYGAIVSRLSISESQEIECPLRNERRREQMSMEDFQTVLRFLQRREMQERSREGE